MTTRVPQVQQDEGRSDGFQDDPFGPVEPERPLTKHPVEENESPSKRNYRRLKEDAQATYRAFRRSPRLETAEQWEETVLQGADDHISGRALIEQLGGEMLIDARTAGILLAIRRGLIEETHATTASDFVLIDMIIANYANAMRMQSIVGNTQLLIEAEFFGQESLSKKLRQARGRWNSTINGLSVEEHIARLRGDLMPLAERFQRMAEHQIEVLTRRRHEPAAHLEHLEPLKIMARTVGRK